MKFRPLSGWAALCLLILLISPIALRAVRSQGAPPKTNEQASRPGEAERVLHFKQKRLPEGEVEIPAERYLKAYEQMREMSLYSTAQNRLLSSAESGAQASWTELGPGNIGGRTRSLVIHPMDANVMFAGAASGGVWKTTDGGASWKPLANGLVNLGVNSLAIDPTNPNVIYAGTGEGYNNIGSIRGAGIFKTTDGGSSWKRLENTAGQDFNYVNDLVISPNDNQRIYAATATGVWRSLDGGANWSRTLEPELRGGCSDLVIRTDQTADSLFASCSMVQQGAVYRNTDAAGAGSWAVVLQETGMGRTSLALAPSNQNIVYASAASQAYSNQPGLFAVFRSTNGGEANSWAARVRGNDANKLNTVLFSWTLDAFRRICHLGPEFVYNTGWYANSIAVDPLDPNRVWVGGVDMFRSDDGGANWGLASYSWLEADQPQYSHAHHHRIVFHPQFDGANNKTMFVAGDGGVRKTEDARAAVATNADAPCDPGKSAVRWASLNQGYAATQFVHGAPLPGGTSYIGGAQDQGFLFGSDESGVNGWRKILGGDGGFVAIDPRNSNNIYTATGYNLIRKSTDGGRTFGLANAGISSGGFLYFSPLIADPSDGQRLWMGGTVLWRTTDGASRWTAGSQPFQSPFSAIAVSPADSNVVLAGNTAGAIYHLPNALNFQLGTFQPAFPPRSGYVSWIAFDPVEPNIAYATYSTFGGQHVWRSLDAGMSWTALDNMGGGTLPDVPVHCIVVDPTNRQRLFIGTDVGVFVSPDGGASWAVETGLPNVVTESLAIQQSANNQAQLFAFTFGRGAWRVELGSVACQFALSAASVSISPSGGPETVTVTAANGCSWQARVNPTGEGWIRLTGSDNGSGNGSISFSTEPNLTSVRRFGTIAVAGRSFTIAQDRFVDTIAPRLKITSPTSDADWTTTESGLVLSGSATDNLGIQRVSWLIDRSGQYSSPVSGGGTATGTANWITDPIPLPNGYSTITVTAEDIGGLMARAQLRVLRLPGSTLVTIAGNGDNTISGDNLPALKTPIGGVTGMALDNAGNLYYVDGTSLRIRKFNLNTGIISTLQAQVGTSGTIAFDAASNLYVLPQYGSRLYKISPSGIVSAIAGTGENGYAGDGDPATQARFNITTDLKIDRAGNIYIADSGNRRVRKIDAATGFIHTVAGTGVNGRDGDGGLATQAQLSNVSSLALDSADNLYIADSGNSAIRKVSKSTGIITTVAGKPGSRGFGGDGGPATQAMFNEPTSLALDAVNNLYIADRSNHRIRKVSAETGVISTVAGNGRVSPDNIAGSILLVDRSGALLLGGARYIRKLVPFRIADEMPPVIRIGTPDTPTVELPSVNQSVVIQGTATDNTDITHLTWSNDRGGGGSFDFCCGLNGWQFIASNWQPGLNRITVTAWDSSGNSSSALLNVTTPGTPGTPPPSGGLVIRTFAGNRQAGFSGDGEASASAQLSAPEAIAFDPSGNLYIADSANHRIRKVARDGRIGTFAGNGVIGGSGDGGKATEASLNYPAGVATDGIGNLYIADSYNHRIRKVTLDGVISTIAGTGIEGFSGDGGQAVNARLNTPNGIAVDPSGNVYFSEYGNHRVRRINAGNGVISTVAGKGFGFAGDAGAATAALLAYPRGIALDAAGNLYLADSGNLRVRKVTAAGIITTIAGNGQSDSPVSGTIATNTPLKYPAAVAFDGGGNLLIADRAGSRVFKVSPDGTQTFFAGNGGTFGEAAHEGTPALSAFIGLPTGLALDRAGNVYISEVYYNRILTVANYQTAASVSAASFRGQSLAADSIAAVFGTDLATTTQVASSVPLPTSLAGTTVRIRDSQGIEQLAPLFFVSPTQINYQLPPGLAAGAATVIIQSGDGKASTSEINIAPIAPGLFTANASGQGVATGELLRFKADGRQIYEPIAVYDQARKQFIPRPIRLEPSGERLFLILYGTGLRDHGDLAKVKVRIDGEELPALYAGPQENFVGLDQINLEVTPPLFNRGEVDLAFVAGNQQSNIVRIAFGEKQCNYQVFSQPPLETLSRFTGSGGNLTFNVGAGMDCGWQARSEVDWITPAFSNPYFISVASATFLVETNPNPAPRTGTVRVAGQVFTIRQEAASSLDSPGLTISGPGNSIITDQPTGSLSGTASGSPGLAFIAWSNNQGGNGFASGLGEWSIHDVPLQVGVNNLIITAYDLLGRSRTLLVTITFKPEFLINTFAGGGQSEPANGVPAGSVKLTEPRGLVFDSAGNLFIGDGSRILKVSPAGNLSVAVGDNDFYLNMLNAAGMTFDAAGNLYFADAGLNCVRKVNFAAKVADIVAGRCRSSGFSGDGGLATQARLAIPTDVALDSAGNLFIADGARIRKVDASTGIITTIAGGGTQSGDDIPATSAVLIAHSLVFGPTGELFVASGARVFKLNLTTGRLIRVAGSESPVAGDGAVGDGGPATAARLQTAYGLAFDSAGNLYVTDANRLRRIAASTGIISTVAGNGLSNNNGGNGDGGSAIQAWISYPFEIEIDKAGGIYFTDGQRVRKLTPFQN